MRGSAVFRTVHFSSTGTQVAGTALSSLLPKGKYISKNGVINYMKRHNNTMIIAVDHGYGSMKTANHCFPSGIPNRNPHRSAQ